MTQRRSSRTGKKSRPRKKSAPAARRFWPWLLGACGALLLAFGLWVVYLDFQVREKFDGKKWSLPARVYARPLELYEGLSLTPALFESELEALGYRFVSQIGAPGQVVRLSGGEQARYRVHSRGFDFWDRREGARAFEVAFEGRRVSSLSGANGTSLTLMRLEPQEIGGIFPAHMEDRLLVRLADLPPLLGETLLAVEDRHFLDHHGVSLRAIARAARANFSSGGVVQGGSTLTQQLVKNFYLTHERSFRRKAQEAIMAVLLEWHYDKAEILETYVNEVFLGQSGPRAVHGFALGAQHYFRQPLAELGTEQIALLVAVVKGASFYNPWRHPQRVTDRRNLVLEIMAREGLISEEEMRRAQAAPLGVVSGSGRALAAYPAYLDMVKAQLRRDYREQDLRSEGLRIFTSLSPVVQRQAEESLSQRLERLNRQHQMDNLQGALVVTAVGSGEVLAMVGDTNPRYAGFNRALHARRPIGSLMKPFIYLTALEGDYHLASTISDDPVTVTSDDGRLWQPRNANLRDHGDIPLYQGLVQSYNQASTRLGMELGLEQVYRSLRAAGYEGRVPAVPSILLGSVEMSPLEVAGIYHTLAAEGVYTPLRAIREVLTAEGEPLRRYPLQLERRFSAEASYQLHYALQMVLREGTGRSVYSQLPAELPLAGKTGTTNDRRDSWFAGFSGEHLAVVWLGRDDNSVTPLTGASGALQVWGDLMQRIPTQGLVIDPPPGISFDWLDSATGLLSAEHCEGAVWLPLRDERQPVGSAPCRLDAENRRDNWWRRLRR